MGLNDMKIGAPAPRYPSKTTMNLVQREKNEATLQNSLIPAILVVVAVFLIARFAFYGPLSKAAAAKAQISSAQAQLTYVESQIADYDSVADEYALYSKGYLDDDEMTQVDRIDALSLIEQQVMSVGSVTSVTIDGNMVSLGIEGITLGQVSDLVSKLKTLPEVADVSVYTGSGDATTVSANMVITLQQVETTAADTTTSTTAANTTTSTTATGTTTSGTATGTATSTTATGTAATSGGGA